MIANLDGCDTLAHALDNGAGLVAKDARELALGVGALPRVHIRVAQRVGDHAHAHLAGPRRVDCDRLDAQRLLGGESHRGLALDGLRRLLRARHQGRRRRRPRWGLARRRRSLRRGLRLERRGMVRDVLANIRRDGKVRVVPGAAPQHELLAHLLGGGFEALRPEVCVRVLLDVEHVLNRACGDARIVYDAK